MAVKLIIVPRPFLNGFHDRRVSSSESNGRQTRARRVTRLFREAVVVGPHRRENRRVVKEAFRNHHRLGFEHPHGDRDGFLVQRLDGSRNVAQDRR